MLYNLPNGKTVYLTLEEYLDLTDQDIQMLMSINAGEALHSPFHSSAIRGKQGKKDKVEEPEEELDTSIDYEPEYDEPARVVSLDEGLSEEFPDVSDEDIAGTE